MNGHVFQVYLIAFAVQWNSRMESLRVAGGHGRQTWCMDPRQIQHLNQQAEVLFGKEHVLEPNFAAPMPYPAVYKDPDEEELLGVEYAMCQSTSFTAKDYYAQQGTQSCIITIYILNSQMPINIMHILSMTSMYDIVHFYFT